MITNRRIISPQQAAEWRQRVKGSVVFTNGVFDILHSGHVALLEAARAEGDALIVGINDDESVESLDKGNGRPFIAALDRAKVLCGLRAVDRVVLFSEPTPAKLIKLLKPDVLVKGGDYAAREIPGADLVEKWGGRVVLVAYQDGKSTTEIARRIRAAS